MRKDLDSSHFKSPSSDKSTTSEDSYDPFDNNRSLGEYLKIYQSLINPNQPSNFSTPDCNENPNLIKIDLKRLNEQDPDDEI